MERLLLGTECLNRDYPVVRKCAAAAQINDFRSVFSLAAFSCTSATQMCCMGELFWIRVCKLGLVAFGLFLNPGTFFARVTQSLQLCLRICQEEELERLEREFAIQSQITEAARRLASDPHVSSKKLKKQRKTSYLNALKKLQEIENSINEYRVRSGKKPTQRASLIIEGANILCVHLGRNLIAFISVSYLFAVIATTDSNILICTVR